jgi:23S rRNA pseudouridine1911/1915/1917 synthase
MAAPRPRGSSPSGKPRASARLIYEDESILAYDKGVGLPVIAPEGSRGRCLLDIASEQVRRRNPKGRAAVVHRIDRDTSGLVIFAVDAATKRLLMGSWDEMISERRYVALVAGRMPGATGLLDSWLKENKAGRVLAAAPGERGAKRALTRWRVLREGGASSLLELYLETGRKHQIRVQLAEAGHPVVGDEKYGRAAGDGPGLGRLCLHASSIEIKLPGREALRLESPGPPEFAAAVSAGRAPSPNLSAPRGASSASPRGARSGARPGRGAPRGS